MSAEIEELHVTKIFFNRYYNDITIDLCGSHRILTFDLVPLYSVTILI